MFLTDTTKTDVSHILFVHTYWFLHVNIHVCSWSLLTKYIENAAPHLISKVLKTHCVLKIFSKQIRVKNSPATQSTPTDCNKLILFSCNVFTTHQAVRGQPGEDRGGDLSRAVTNVTFLPQVAPKWNLCCVLLTNRLILIPALVIVSSY